MWTTVAAGVPHARKRNLFKQGPDPFSLVAAVRRSRVVTQKLRTTTITRNHFLPSLEQVSRFAGFLVVARPLLQTVARFR